MYPEISIPTPQNPFVIPISSARGYDWRDDALCTQADPEAFFPEKSGSTREAKDLCQRCDVREKCLEWALDNDERQGIWGGLTNVERQKLKRQRNGTAIPAREPMNAQRNRKIIEARIRGASPDQVAAQFNVSVAVVHRVAGPDKRRAHQAAQVNQLGGGDEIAQAI